MTARPSVFFRTPLTCIPAAILRRSDGAGRWCRRHCGATTHVGAPFMTPGAGTARPVRGIALGGVRGGAGKLRYYGGPTGRHKCRLYGTGCSSAILRQAVAVNGRRFRRRGRSLQTHDSSRNGTFQFGRRVFHQVRRCFDRHNTRSFHRPTEVQLSRPTA